jgi:hypothetical protein
MMVIHFLLMNFGNLGVYWIAPLAHPLEVGGKYE